MTIEQAYQLACDHHAAGRFAQAEGIYRQILSAHPKHADSMHLLGTLAHQTGHSAAGIDLIRQAIALNPNQSRYYNNLGLALTETKQLEQAELALQTAVRLDPRSSHAYYNLGRVLAMLHRNREAIDAYSNSVRLNRNFAAAWNNLANLYKDAAEFGQAEAAYQSAIQLDPRAGDYRSNLGQLYQQFGHIEPAEQMFTAALKLDASLTQAHTGLGNVMKDLGRLGEAMVEYRKALSLSPADQRANSNLLYAMFFDPASTAKTIGEEHARWDAQLAAPLRANPRPHRNDRNPDRKLRIGYVSPDFFRQAESFFVVPLLRSHDREKFEIHGYSSVRIPDDMTATIKGLCDQWHEVLHLSDDGLAERIREDQIDILIDLTMHMSLNRILTFARKPAPVQIAWLAYPGTTGLRNMDYRITDRFMDPEGSDQNWSAERPIRLPDSWCVYDALESDSKVSALPAEKNGYITFGSMNNFCKTNRRVIELWAELLARVPKSRLMLAAPPQPRREILAMFASKGVDASRIEFLGPLSRPDYLAMYDRFDIGLDPFPYNGITTTCDAIWKGVPVLTLTGPLPQERAGMSLLQTVGLAEFVTHSRETYFERAIELSGDPPKLANLRAGLRERMIASPLHDAKRFARSMETAYRNAWHEWCAGNA